MLEWIYTWKHAVRISSKNSRSPLSVVKTTMRALKLVTYRPISDYVGLRAHTGSSLSTPPKSCKLCLQNTNANTDVPTCHVQRVLLEDDVAVIVKIQIADVCFLHKLGDYVLTGGADQYLTANLHGTTVKCDIGTFAEDYEELSLMLNKPTPAQRRVLQIIAESSGVHLKALAGAGKTFVILSVLEDAFQTKSYGTVLVISKTMALLLFIASWLWRRTKPRLRRNKLARLCVMYGPLESGRHSIHLNVNTGMLESRELAEPANKIHTHVILDEAHHCCRTAEQRDLIMQHASPETKILMCSDLSQAVGTKAAVCESEGMHQCQLDQVVRNTQRVTMASLPFGLECNTPVEWETSFGLECNTPVDRGRAQDDVGLMGQTDMRSREENGAVNEA